MHYYVLWGEGSDVTLRYARAKSEQEACKAAFGLYTPDMTARVLPKNPKYMSHKAKAVFQEELIKFHQERLDEEK